MDDEYRKLIHEFHSIYDPLRKAHNLRMSSHSSIYESEDDWIEIWEYEGERKKKLVVREKEKNIEDCYKRAIEELKSYEQTFRAREMQKVAAVG